MHFWRTTGCRGSIDWPRSSIDEASSFLRKSSLRFELADVRAYSVHEHQSFFKRQSGPSPSERISIRQERSPDKTLQYTLDNMVRVAVLLSITLGPALAQT